MHDMMIGFDINLLKSRRYITMENVMKNGFAELSSDEIQMVDGGSTDWGKVGYNLAYGWCSFWGGVGEKAYDLFH